MGSVNTTVSAEDYVDSSSKDLGVNIGDISTSSDKWVPVSNFRKCFNSGDLRVRLRAKSEDRW